MLTRMMAQVFPAAPRRLGMSVALALALMPWTLAPARADGIRTSNCLYAWGARSCVSQWHRNPRNANIRAVAPPDARETAEAAERERIWTERCRPVVKQDGYGVGRYHYAAAGCEFGKMED